MPVDWRGDSATFERDLARLPSLAENAACLGLMRTATWVLPEVPAHQDAHAVVAFHVERIGRIARVLHGYGIRLGLEVVSALREGRGEPFVARMADLDPVLGALWDEAPNLGVLLDAFHLYAAGEAIEAGLAWGVERVVWVHVADLPATATGERTAIRDADRGLPGGARCRRVSRFVDATRNGRL